MIINVCNGANSGNCVEADELSNKAIRRPYKRPSVDDADYGNVTKANPKGFADWNGEGYDVKAPGAAPAAKKAALAQTTPGVKSKE